jgi:hypothetical protein
LAAKRRSSDARPKPIRTAAVEERGRLSSTTAVAAEAMRTGVIPGATRRRPSEIPSEDGILFGDPDTGVLANEYGGEDTPGGSSPTPDQNDVDAIGRAYGVAEEDSGSLRTTSELLAGRDRRRPELTPRRRRV